MNHKPWQQGHFDGLCGIYSLINSMMYLHHGKIVEKDCEALFKYLIDHTPKATIYNGLDFEPLCDLAEHIPGYLKNHHKTSVTLTRPFVSEDIESSDEFFDLLGCLVADSRTCAIIGLGEPWDHWTVVTKVTKKAVRFFDSYGIKRFDKNAFSLIEAEDSIKIDFRETILITRK